MSTDVAVVDEQNQELVAVSDAAAQALAAQQASEYGDETLATPFMKVGQALTKEVSEGEANAGEFINTLSGSTYGTVVDFIAAFYNRGRFASDQETERAYVA